MSPCLLFRPESPFFAFSAHFYFFEPDLHFSKNLRKFAVFL